MKNPYKRGKVYPSPPPPTPDHCLSLLPTTLLALAVALSAEDQKVLAYLITCCGNSNAAVAGTDKSTAHAGGEGDHTPLFGCDCFCCYMSYWVRWDASPNRQVIHEIIEAYEEEQRIMQKNRKRKKKDFRKRENSEGVADDLVSEVSDACRVEEDEVVENCCSAVDVTMNANPSSSPVLDDGENKTESLASVVENKSSVRKFVGLIGDKMWGLLRGY